MKTIITDLTQLEGRPAEPLKFINETGIEKEEGQDIINSLLEVLDSNKNIVALSAPQIGINKRIFCIRFNDTIKTFIDPVIKKKAKKMLGVETCSSMPGKEILIERPEELTVIYYNEKFEYEDNKFLGMAARLFEQQCQLLDGITPDILGLVSDINTDGSLKDLTEEEFIQVKEIYAKYVKTKSDALQAEIKDNAELAKQYKQLNFAEKVITGDITLVESDDEAKARQKAKDLADKSMIWSGKQSKQMEKATNQAHLKEFLNKKRK